MRDPATNVRRCPHRPDDALRLITLWASDFAARLELPYVRAEFLIPCQPDGERSHRLLSRLADMGWDQYGRGAGPNTTRVVRLELASEHRPGLSALVGYRIREPRPTSDGRGSW